MGAYGDFLGAPGDLWGPMGSYGEPQGPLGAHGHLWALCPFWRAFWGPVGAHCYLCGPMRAYGDQWEPIGTFRVVWGPMEPFGGLWGPLRGSGVYGALCGPPRAFGNLWVLMGTYGHLFGAVGAYGNLRAHVQTYVDPEGLRGPPWAIGPLQGHLAIFGDLPGRLGSFGAFGDFLGPMAGFGDLCGSLGAHGDLWRPMGPFGVPMGAYGELWVPMGTYGDLWEPKGTFGGYWAPPGIFGDLWGPAGTVGANGRLWGSLGTYGGLVPFVNQPFEWDIHGTVNLTIFSFLLHVTWCHCVRFSCYVRPKRGPTNVSSHFVSVHFFSTAFVPCTCASRAGTRRETRPHKLDGCAGSPSTPTAAQHPLNSTQQFSENVMNVLATSSLTKAIKQQTYHARNATNLSATLHGTRLHQPRTQPARQSSTLQTHYAHAYTVTVHQDKLRSRMGRTIRLVLHHSLLCLVLCSMKPHGSGQSITSAVMSKHRTAHHSRKKFSLTPLRLGDTATNTYREPAAKNITILKQCTEPWINTSSPKCSPNGTPLPAWRDATRKRSTTRGDMEGDRKTPATRVTPPRAC